MFRGVLGVYMVYMTCITGVHRCTYGNAGVLRGYTGGNPSTNRMQTQRFDVPRDTHEAVENGGGGGAAPDEDAHA